MKGLFFIIAIVNIWAVTAYSQDESVNHRFVEAPRDVILTVVAFQPSCPIRFEDARFLVGVGGGGTVSYRIRNVSMKPIRTVTVVSSHGTFMTYANDGKVLAHPGQLVPLVSEEYLKELPKCGKCAKTEVVPLTAELRERLHLKPPMRSIVVLIIAEVEFMDGTKFNDQKSSDAMVEVMDRIGDAMRSAKPERD